MVGNYLGCLSSSLCITTTGIRESSTTNFFNEIFIDFILNFLNLFLILYSFPVLQMGNRVASTSAGSSDTQSASPKALFPTASQVRSSMPALLWQPAA